MSLRITRESNVRQATSGKPNRERTGQVAILEPDPNGRGSWHVSGRGPLRPSLSAQTRRSGTARCVPDFTYVDYDDVPHNPPVLRAAREKHE